jgi:hypothetical protein
LTGRAPVLDALEAGVLLTSDLSAPV